MAVVVSAIGKTADNIVNLAKKNNSNPDNREFDVLPSTGEQISAALLSMALHNFKIKIKSINAFQASIRTEGHFNNARIKDFNSKKILELLNIYDVIVVT